MTLILALQAINLLTSAALLFLVVLVLRTQSPNRNTGE